ncbi:MAG TPA: hypothetical protein PKH93_06615 [Chitinophagales bacterium]|jgi:hypothetical protein|nr:hypothetical protein [Chitinophagales bacterium]
MKAKLFFYFLAAYCFYGCGGNSSDTQTASITPFYGNWLNKKYFDSLVADTVKGLPDHIGFSEIIFTKADSVQLCNYHDRPTYEKYTLKGKDSIKVNHFFKYLVLDEKTQTIKFDGDVYMKAPNSALVRNPDTRQQEAFSKHLYCVLAKKTYSLVERNQKTDKKVQFTCDGNISGLKDFTKFELYVNGKKDVVDNAYTLICSGNGKDKILGLTFVQGGVDLYDIVDARVPEAPASANPFYQKGGLYAKLRH